MRSSIRCAGVIVGMLTLGLVVGDGTAFADEPEGTAFGQPCAAVTILAIPGSTETTEAAGMDVAQGVLADVMNKIGSHDSSVRVHFLGYPAKLVPYGDSRSHGYEAAWSTVNYYAQQCATTSFILTGYSQGAHVAGDLAATIGQQGSPVPTDRVRSVRLLADPARDPSVQVVGTGGSAGGLFSARGDFGDLGSRVTEYCNDDDLVCNNSVAAAGDSLSTWFGPHTTYQTTVVPATGETYTQQMADDLVQDVVNLNAATF